MNVKCFSNFLFEINAKKIISNYTCYKNAEISTCIDLVITNSPLSFVKMVIITTGL